MRYLGTLLSRSGTNTATVPSVLKLKLRRLHSFNFDVALLSGNLVYLSVVCCLSINLISRIYLYDTALWFLSRNVKVPVQLSKLRSSWYFLRIARNQRLHHLYSLPHLQFVGTISELFLKRDVK